MKNQKMISMDLFNKKRYFSYWKFIVQFFSEEKAGSMVESGLLIGFAILIFFLLLTVVETIYNWIEQNLTGVLNLVTS